MNKTELKYNVMNTGSYFFDRSSMKFFGDTMSNYYVPKATVKVDTYTREGIECYELQRVRPVKHGLNSSAFFAVDTFENIHPKQGE